MTGKLDLIAIADYPPPSQWTEQTIDSTKAVAAYKTALSKLGINVCLLRALKFEITCYFDNMGMS
jgi:hypothetical protein